MKCPSKLGKIYEIDGEVLTECPTKLVWPISRQYLKWFAYFQKGNFPFTGPAGRQPAKLLDAFVIIEDEINKQSEKKINA